MIQLKFRPETSVIKNLMFTKSFKTILSFKIVELVLMLLIFILLSLILV